MKRVNVKKLGGRGCGKNGVVYCGRPSVLGNPYVIGRDGDRDEVIEKYRWWLWGKLKGGDRDVISEFENLNESSVLGCWCDENSNCHCDVIIRAWKWWKQA